MTTLIVGGTGPTGAIVAASLLEAGHDLAIFHRGTHEVPGLETAEHLHGDPFDAESIAATIGDRTFDVVVASYGRVRLLAEALAGRCERLISISGAPVYAGYLPGTGPHPATPIPEDHPLLAGDGTGLPYPAHRVRDTERALLDLHAAGAFAVTVLRYATLYGPRVPHPWEWSIVRRILDGRDFIVLPDGGLSIHARAATANAAHAVLGAVAAGDVAAGQIYNVADEVQYTLAQWVGAAAAALGADLEVVTMPGDVASPGWSLFPFGYRAISPHLVLDVSRSVADLGYHDVVAPLDALRATVGWCRDVPGEVRPDHLLDRFDYAAEDALVAAYRTAMAGLADLTEPFADVGELVAPQSGRFGRGSTR